MCAIRLLTSLKLCAIIFHSSFRINCLQTGDKDDWLAQHLPGILSRGCRRLWYWLAHAEWATDYQILCINFGHSNYPCWGDLKWISSGGQGVVKLWAMPIIFDMFPSQGFEIWLDWMINKCPFHELYWSQSAFFRTDYHPIHFYKKGFPFCSWQPMCWHFACLLYRIIMCEIWIIYLWRKGRKGLGSMRWGDLNWRN